MSQGLRDIWGLSAPQPVGPASAEQAQEFRKAFAEKMAVINRSLKQAAPYGQSTQQSALDIQRQALYAAYQKVLSQMDAGQQGDADRVLTAAESLRNKSQAYVQGTESARQEWFERESEIERVMERVSEMEDNNPDKAEQIRDVIEKIQSKAYEGNYGESTRAADQFLPKFDPIYEDYLRQSGQQENTTVPLGEYSGEEQVGPYGEVPLGEYSGEGQVDPYGNWPAIGQEANSEEEAAAGPEDRPPGGEVAHGEYHRGQPMAEYGSDVIDNIPLDPEMYGTGAPWKAEEIKKAASEAYDWAGDKVDEAKKWTTEKSEEVYKMAQGGDSRPLTEDEIKYAKDIFGDKVDYSKIRVKRGSVGSIGSSRTIGNDICMADDEFDADTMELNEEGIKTLIHEMTHVHQYQKDGWEYAPKALWEQAKAEVFEGHRNHAYDWEEAEAAGKDPTEWNPEEQGKVVEDYNILLRQKQKAEKEGKTLNPEALAKLDRMKKHVDKIINAPPEKDIIDEAGEAVTDAWDWTKETAEEIADGAEEIYDDATEAASEAWDDATEAVSDAWDSAKETAGEAWDNATEAASESWDSATEAAGDAWDSATETAEEVWDGATEAASEAWDGATEAASEAWDSAQETASEVYNEVSDAASDAADFVTEQASETYDSVSETASETYDTVSSAASDAADYVSETATEVADTVSETASEVADTVSETASEVADTVSETASEAIDDAGDMAKDAWNSVFG